MTINKKRGFILRVGKLKSGSLVSIIIYITLVFGLLHDMMGIPGAILFINDFLLIFGLMISVKKLLTLNKEIKLFLLLYFLYLFSAYIINYNSIFYFIYGLRNYFRYYIFLLLTASTYGDKNVGSMLNFLDKFFYVNCVVMAIQYVGFGYSQDHLGGFFGISYGCNGSLNILFIIVTGKSLIYALDNKESLRACLLKCGLCLLFSALSELKVYYFEFILIIAYVFLTTRFSWKKVLIVIASIGGILGGVYLLVALFPGFAGFFTYEGALKIIGKGSYSDSSAFNRLTFAAYFNRSILTSRGQQLIGLGLGNCDTSSISIFTTPFYEIYGWTHYDWFSAPFAYLEQGIIGVMFYLAFFILVAVKSVRCARKGQISYNECRLVSLCCIMSMVLFIYNQSMRTEAAFLMYFLMAIPFVRTKYLQRIKK